MLLIQKSFTEAARALSLWVGMLIDEAHSHPDAARREAADDLIQLLTPIIKAYFTDRGRECANLAVQTYGGPGYIRENGVEQLVRDARITQLYEGTNGIQALDLVGRKLPMKGGQAARRLLAEMSGFVAEHKADDKMKEFVEPLEKALGRVQDAALFLMQHAMKNPDEAGAAATDLLRLMALTAMTFMWNRIAVAAHQGLARGNYKTFFRAKAAPPPVNLPRGPAAPPRADPPDQGGCRTLDGPAGRGVLMPGARHSSGASSPAEPSLSARDLLALQAFELAARSGSFKAAAETLHITASAISH